MRILLLGLVLWSTTVFAASRVGVEGHGRNLEEAKQNGFRTAIEFVVGQVVIGDTEVNGDRITKDFVGSYSAGYIEDYEIRDTHYVGGEVVVFMAVKVADSKIAQRMLTSGDHKTVVQGQKLQDRLNSMLDQRGRGDRLLTEVLGSYPRNAHILITSEPKLTIGIRRQVYIDIPYEIRWSRLWLESLTETLDLVSLESRRCKNFPSKELENFSLSLNIIRFLQEKSCGFESDMTVVYKPADSWMLKKYNYYFPDLSTLDLVNSEIRSPVGKQHVGLVVDLKDAGGNYIASRCFIINTEPLIEYTRSKTEVDSIHGRNPRPRIQGHMAVAGTLRIEGLTSEELGNLARGDTHIEKSCS